MDKTDLEFYGEYAPLLTGLEARLNGEISAILTQLAQEAGHSPAEHTLSRIKSAGSLRAKLKKQGLSEDAKTGLTQLSDLVGARVVTHFIGDVYAILARLERSDKWEVAQVKDYISNPKPNGYRSLHVLLRMPVEHPDFSTVAVEIQLRTIAMDCWASLEHQMKYKKTIPNASLITQELKRCADEIASTDLTMQTIRDLIESQ
ncbi:MAG: GTP pyrophosphokinase family protein [Oscillospiraceae bacterium]|nr:GTP pyrophosphokinase family protein [Oscillospiraceae bacterium]